MTIRRTRARRRAASALLGAALLATGCNAADTGGGGDEPAASDDGGGTADGGATEGTYDPDLVAAAQEEGEVVVYSGAHTREHADLAAQLFEEEFGITVTLARQTSGAVRQQVEAELAAGALGADVVASNDETSLEIWGEEGVTTDAELPNRDQLLEQLDDGDSAYVPYTWTPLGVMYNTNELEESDIPDSWAELPEMDVPFVHSDPRSSGVALGYTWSMVELVGEEFYSDLAEREVLTSESGTAVGQMVATGEALVAIPGPEVLLGPLAEEGEPVGLKYLSEGVPAIPSYLAQVSDSPNPNAGQLFVQWHAGPTFQDALVEIGGRSVVEGAAGPEGAPEIDIENLLVPPGSEVNEQRDELGSLFEQVLG